MRGNILQQRDETDEATVLLSGVVASLRLEKCLPLQADLTSMLLLRCFHFVTTTEFFPPLKIGLSTVGGDDSGVGHPRQPVVDTWETR